MKNELPTHIITEVNQSEAQFKKVIKEKKTKQKETKRPPSKNCTN